MGVKVTPKQEIFCQEIVKGATQADAYRAAYAASGTRSKLVHEEASKLMTNPKVSQRLAELRAPIAKMTDMSMVAHVTRLAELRDSARASNNHSAAVAAEKCIGQVAGHYVTRVDVNVTQMAGMNAQDKAMLLEAMAAELDRRKALSAPQQFQQLVEDVTVKTPKTDA